MSLLESQLFLVAKVKIKKSHKNIKNKEGKVHRDQINVIGLRADMQYILP